MHFNLIVYTNTHNGCVNNVSFHILLAAGGLVFIPLYRIRIKTDA